MKRQREQSVSKKKKMDYKNSKTIYEKIYKANVHVCLLEMDGSYYVDIRKFYGTYPSVHGVSVPAESFQTMADGVINKINEIKYGPGAPLETPILNASEDLEDEKK